jgi:effector-binding domain-containing protein
MFQERDKGEPRGQKASGVDKMNVQIVTLGPMRLASVYAFGTDPRREAWEKLVDWVGPRGFLNRKNEHPVFGFNNPSPNSGSPKYGYELWIKVGSEVQQDGELRIIEFDGGSYAVARCKVCKEAYENITAAWKNLIEWCKNNNYRPGYHQALEKFVTRGGKLDDFILDLYYPIIY